MGKADISTDFSDVKAAFRSSVTPQVYATGAATVLAWMLVIMLLITPRTFFVGGVGGGVGLLGRRGMISGSQGGASVIGVGSRPWLQKVAALTVAVSLTIASADTFEVAERQYLNGGFMNADSLRIEVVNSTLLKVSRLISDIFLWLAQVQTLIRLFPRHKEKVLIKWIGFALIVLDTTFSCLNSFAGTPAGRATRFRDAIPALSYLFQLALSMLYACWVLYYAICKRRYAFYHSYMWNVSVVAFVSIVAIATPVVFFITDIANSSVAGWGDYFRWVGAAAASVIVWEWVERIEALEREEKKDGILGREVFDGDENDDDDLFFEQSRRRRRLWAGGNRSSGNGGYATGADRGNSAQNNAHRAARRSLFTSTRGSGSGINEKDSTENSGNIESSHLNVPTPPPQTVSPISRSDTASAASTVYQIHYNSVNVPMPPVNQEDAEANRKDASRRQSRIPQSQRQSRIGTAERSQNEQLSLGAGANTSQNTSSRWANPFKRRKAEPPSEVRQGHVIDPVSLTTETKPIARHNYAPWDIKGRIGAFAAEQGEKWRENRQGRELDLPVTIIPAASRNPAASERPWSPEGSTVEESRTPFTPSSSQAFTLSSAALTQGSQAHLLSRTTSNLHSPATTFDTASTFGVTNGDAPSPMLDSISEAPRRTRNLTISIEEPQQHPRTQM